MSSIACETCKYRKSETPAVHYCGDCEEGLCSDCYQHHTHSKTSRTHGVISLEDYEKLPNFIRNIKHYCKEHDEKYEHFCPTHNQPCCQKSAITEHKNCKDLQKINNAIHGVKSSNEFKLVDEKIENIKQNLEHILKDKEMNMKLINESKQKFKIEISEVRTKFINLLDSLEKEIQDKLSAVEKEVSRKLEDFMDELKSETVHLSKLQENVTAIKKHASDFQTYLGMKELKDEVDEKNKYLQSLRNDKRLERITLNCKIDEKIKSFIKDIRKFGEVNTESNPTNDPFITVAKKKEPPPTVEPSKPRPTASPVQARLRRKLTVPPGPNKNTITGCAILPNGKFVFVDGTYNQRVVILDNHGTTFGEITLSPSFAFDVTCIDGKTVAITTGSSGQVSMANISLKKIKKTISTTWQCDGISYTDGKLIMAMYSKGIHAMNLETRQVTSILDENITVDTHLTAFENKIYHTNWKVNTVTCYSMEGKVIWTYHDEKMLKKPRGIAVDRNHNVYVASLGTESVIVVISPDGKQGRHLLGQKDDIENVRAVYFDNVNNCLLVSGSSGSAALFDIM